MKLLVAQLQNQNPLEPLSNGEMASQLAQLSSLEQLEGMNSSFSRVLLAQQTSQATGLIGKRITYFLSGEETARSGIVSSVDISTGSPRVIVGSLAVELRAIQTITQPGSAASGGAA
jgi:flagellar basal-body rod modification protein FlgD